MILKPTLGVRLLSLFSGLDVEELHRILYLSPEDERVENVLNLLANSKERNVFQIFFSLPDNLNKMEVIKTRYIPWGNYSEFVHYLGKHPDKLSKKKTKQILEQPIDWKKGTSAKEIRQRVQALYSLMEHNR